MPNAVHGTCKLNCTQKSQCMDLSGHWSPWFQPSSSTTFTTEGQSEEKYIYPRTRAFLARIKWKRHTGYRHKGFGQQPSFYSLKLHFIYLWATNSLFLCGLYSYWGSCLCKTEDIMTDSQIIYSIVFFPAILSLYQRFYKWTTKPCIMKDVILLQRSRKQLVRPKSANYFFVPDVLLQS